MQLVPCCLDPAQRATMEQLAGSGFAVPKYREEGLLTLLDILRAFPALQLSLEQFLASTVPLRRRYYSISSAPPDSLSITVGAGNEQRPDGLKPYRGICSWPLCLCKPGDYIFARVVESSFRLPQNPRVPVIMVCAGTGIAPFRSFWRARPSRRMYLYFGCRDQTHRLHHKELQSLVEHKRLELRVAMSRSGPTQKYVQHLLVEDAQAINALLRPDDPGDQPPAHIYVCGRASSVGVGVHTALQDILKGAGECIPPDDCHVCVHVPCIVAASHFPYFCDPICD